MAALKDGRQQAELACLAGGTQPARAPADERPGRHRARSQGVEADGSERISPEPRAGCTARMDAEYAGVPSDRVDATRRSGARLARATERLVLAIIKVGLPVLNRRCATLARMLGAIGVAFGLVPVFFGLAWNFGGVATCLALYARYRRREGDRRISHLATKTGFVLGVSAVLLGCGDLAILVAGA